MSYIILILILLYSPITLAEEMDHFSDRLFMLEHLTEPTQKDSILDKEVNRLLDQLSQQLKSKAPKNIQQRDQKVASVFLHPIASLRVLITPYANWIARDSPVPVFFPNDRGIYGWDVDYSNMLMAWYVRLVPILKLNGVLQGTDKIGHFFGQGWMYYEEYENLKLNFPQLSEAELDEKIREFGHETEMGTLGFGTGGVYSYADLAANWQGFRFFQELFKGPQAYFKEENGVYQRQRTFTWADYITDQWDEVIKPSRLTDQESYDKVAANFWRNKTNGRSICQEYLSDPKSYMNLTGRSLPDKEYLWQKMDHAQLQYFIDVKTICSIKK